MMHWRPNAWSFNSTPTVQLRPPFTRQRLEQRVGVNSSSSAVRSRDRSRPRPRTKSHLDQAKFLRVLEQRNWADPFDQKGERCAYDGNLLRVPQLCG